MFNQSKKAIASLNKHLSDITSISTVEEGNTWKAALKDTVNLYIGEKSSISQRLDNLLFTREEHHTVEGVIGFFLSHTYDESKKQDFKDLIKTAIKYIELNGVYKKTDKNNILYNFNNVEIISGAAFVVLLVFNIGSYFGRIEKDKEALRAEAQIKKNENENNILIKANDSLKQIAKDWHDKYIEIQNDTLKNKIKNHR